MKKYTDGYYIYQHVDFICHFNLQQCDGCNRTLTGFVYELQIQSLENESVIFCAECMELLDVVNAE
ncbi:hypothetical protein ACNPQK_13840 [Acinetobacter guillouiae]|jgi:hypothetical protein|uniref:Uncharacterized protein n=2 Tax=Acinetobacter guillouiae TaxID=106649 RepID=N8X4A1_ACIGI|nr:MULTISPECIES: hypothetical protein [Acinetobacter]ENV19192.1 hypothetical protein F964_00289 [Acinetobacter guillouiae NIPH 991]KEC82464.1 hypothetical protein DT74_02685 [Acinetobacter sp. ETR1]KQX02430.1 hypothetical protein ASC84_15915 [Acinetobacter sp. Root1280]MBP2545843.1 hypothetical protein [Acinetobacter guillouiae]MCF0266338.1 hypothetical protein [Acinetobacter guillouiae]